MKLCISALKKYAMFSGRAQRSEFWFFYSFIFLISVGIIIIERSTGRFIADNNIGVLSTVFAMGIMMPLLAVTVRRLHDNAFSGWWLLIGLIPIIGYIVIVLFLVLDSDPFHNSYGPCPKKTNAEEKGGKHWRTTFYFASALIFLSICCSVQYTLVTSLGAIVKSRSLSLTGSSPVDIAKPDDVIGTWRSVESSDGEYFHQCFTSQTFIESSGKVVLYKISKINGNKIFLSWIQHLAEGFRVNRTSVVEVYSNGNIFLRWDDWGFSKGTEFVRTSEPSKVHQ
jgi:uncharacterized membrane protein YhaH (DUF805 family)